MDAAASGEEAVNRHQRPLRRIGAVPIGLMSLMTVVAGCGAGHPASPPKAGASPSAQMLATPDASPLASSSATGVASTGASSPAGVDGEARALLTAIVGDAPMEIDDEDPAQAIGDHWDEAFAERIADQIGVDPSALTLTLARPADGQEHRLPDGWTVMTVGFPAGNPRGVLGAYLAERLTRPGTEAALVDDLTDSAGWVMGSEFSVAWTEAALVVMGYDRVAYFTDPQADPAHAEDVLDALSRAFAALPGEHPPAPVPNPGPANEQARSAPPDPSLEAAMPTIVADEPLTISSAAGLPDRPPDNLASGLFGYALPHFDQPGTDAAVAFASADGVGVLTIAHRLAGRSGDQLLAAALGELWSAPGGFQLYHGEDVDGRRIVYHQDWGFHARDDVMYFFVYYGGYECSDDRGRCTFGPDEKTRRWLTDFVRAIPDGGS